MEFKVTRYGKAGRWQAHRVCFLIYNRTIYFGSLIEQNNKILLRQKGSRSVRICGKNSFNNNICCSQRGNRGLTVITPKTPLIVFEDEKCFLFKLQSITTAPLVCFLVHRKNRKSRNYVVHLPNSKLYCCGILKIYFKSVHNCQCKVYFTFPKGMIRSNNGHSRSINVFLTLHLDNKHNGQI